MEPSVNLSHFSTARPFDPQPLELAARLVRDAGYRFVDFSPEYVSNNWESEAAAQIETVQTAGLTVRQSHAPYNRYGHYDAGGRFWELFHQSFVTAAMAGSRYMVVHGDEYRTTDHYDPKEIVEYTYRYIAPEVEYAVAHGMQVAIENLFEDPARPAINGKSRFTSRIEELLMLMERFNDPSVCVCWDFGHSSVAYSPEHCLDALKKVGAYVRCTHVHDNYYDRDLHLVPFCGKIPWKEHMAYLREINYSGTLSFELGYEHIPAPLLPQWINMTYQVGRTLCTMAEND